MAEDDKQANKKSPDDISGLIPKNANIGIVSIANGGGVGMIGSSNSPIIGSATSGGSPSVEAGHDNSPAPDKGDEEE